MIGLFPFVLALLLGLALFLLLLTVLNIFKQEPTNLPHGNMGWPLLGETLGFLKPHKSNSMGSFLQQHCSRYGKVFKSHLFGYPTIVSCDLELNAYVLQNEGRLFQSSYPKPVHDILGKLSLMLVCGELHKKLRNVAVSFISTYKSRPDLHLYVEKMSISVMKSWKDRQQVLFFKEAKQSTLKLGKLQEWAAMQIRNSFIAGLRGNQRDYGTMSSITVNGSFTLHLMLKNLLNIEPEEPRALTILEDFLTFMKGFVSLPLYVPGTPYTKAVKARARISSTLKEIIEEREKSDLGIAKGDFVDEFLLKGSLNMEEKVSIVMDLLLAGYETTSGLLALVVHFLGQTPSFLEQLKDEHQALRRSKKKGESLSWEDYKKMELTSKVICEALRCGNLVKFVHRKAIQDVKFKGYLIPKGWQVLPMFSAAHLDPSLHDNPSEFNPWRWADPATSKKVTPFGGGLRLCPGPELGKVETAFFLHHLVLNYRWKTREDDYPMSYPYMEFKKDIMRVDSDYMMEDGQRINNLGERIGGELIGRPFKLKETIWRQAEPNLGFTLSNIMMGLFPFALALLLGLALFYLRLTVFNILKQKPTDLPHGSMGWPLLGETLGFLKPHKSNSMGSFLQQHCSRYGRVFKSHLFGYPTIVSCDLELNAYVLQNEGRLFQSSYPKPVHDILGKLSLMLVCGELHKKLRNVAVNFISTYKSRPDLHHYVEKMSISVMKSWKDRQQVLFFKEAKQKPPKIRISSTTCRCSEPYARTNGTSPRASSKPIPMPSVPSVRGGGDSLDPRGQARAQVQPFPGPAAGAHEPQSAMQIKSSFIAGLSDNQRYYGTMSLITFTLHLMLKNLLNIEPEEPRALTILEDFLTFMKGFVSLPLYVPGTPYTKAVKARARISSTLKEIIEEREKSDLGIAKGDFVDEFLLKGSLNMEEKVSIVMDLLLAGYETTSGLLALVVHFLGQAPSVLEQLKDEHQALRRSKKKGEPLSWEDYKKMELTSKVICEALRCGNLVKFVHRKAIQDVKFKGYLIPKGWQVLPMFSAAHLDPSLHDNPSEFNPWRWADPAMSKKVTPFGGGLRLCPGPELGKVETAFFLHHLVLNYRWKTREDDYPMSYPYMEFKKGLLLEIEPTEKRI
ncbi:hypothetical protein RJ640_028037 [Escallonia rubra]|uniref:Cytochrome P450 n=1 Tax=Escallonia rubra TaxID=112253 RepID=A0AA88QI01_9ASTE|nr:hypothetical protein RJ640_028037 [Escallonia rubra]